MLGNRASLQPWAGGILIFALIVVNLLLVRQNYSLRTQLTARANAVSPAAQSLKEGEVVPSLVGSDLNGHPFEQRFQNSEKQHLLLYFSPSCAYCIKQAPLWRDVLNKIDSNRVEAIGIVSDREDRQTVFRHVEELGYFKTRNPLPVLFVSNELLASYKLMATPTTLLISDSGNLARVWVGKWDEAKTNEVAEALR
jgi:peroxiredoxin